MRLLPRAGRVALLARGQVDVVAEPAAPARRDLRGVGVAVVDHPAPLRADRAVDQRPLRAVIRVAVVVAADEVPAARGVERERHRLPVPPREDAQQRVLERHRRPRAIRRAATEAGAHRAVMVSGRARVQNQIRNQSVMQGAERCRPPAMPGRARTRHATRSPGRRAAAVDAKFFRTESDRPKGDLREGRTCPQPCRREHNI